MRLALLLLAGIGVACATPVTLDDYRGLYTTHFDGIPDRALVCAVLTNRGERPVDWVRLRLVSSSSLGEQPGRWVSDWVWSGSLEPGGSVAIRLTDPPVAERMVLRVRGSGRDPKPRGRPSEPAAGCSIDSLRREARASQSERTAYGIELHAALPRGDVQELAPGEVGQDLLATGASR